MIIKDFLSGAILGRRNRQLPKSLIIVCLSDEDPMISRRLEFGLFSSLPSMPMGIYLARGASRIHRHLLTHASTLLLYMYMYTASLSYTCVLLYSLDYKTCDKGSEVILN